MTTTFCVCPARLTAPLHLIDALQFQSGSRIEVEMHDTSQPSEPKELFVMIYQPPHIQRRGILKPVLDRLIRQSFRVMPTNPPSIRLDWRVERLRHFINTAHGKLGWSLDSICKELDLGVSGSHGARLFKRHTGLGIREYTKRKRLAVAADQLKGTTLSIKEIAADLGYKSQTDLSRQFKHLFCLNPTEFRIAHRHAERQSVLLHGLNQVSDPVLEKKSGT